MTFTPDAIRALRVHLGLSQEKFAARLDVTAGTVHRWETGRGKPSPLAMKALAGLELFREAES